MFKKFIGAVLVVCLFVSPVFAGHCHHNVQVQEVVYPERIVQFVEVPNFVRIERIVDHGHSQNFVQVQRFQVQRVRQVQRVNQVQRVRVQRIVDGSRVARLRNFFLGRNVQRQVRIEKIIVR